MLSNEFKTSVRIRALRSDMLLSYPRNAYGHLLLLIDGWPARTGMLLSNRFYYLIFNNFYPQAIGTNCNPNRFAFLSNVFMRHFL